MAKFKPGDTCCHYDINFYNAKIIAVTEIVTPANVPPFQTYTIERNGKIFHHVAEHNLLTAEEKRKKQDKIAAYYDSKGSGGYTGD